MLTVSRIQILISRILTTGTLLAASLVLIGGMIFLYQSGHQPVMSVLNQPMAHFSSLLSTWDAARAFSPLGIVELGVITLIITQLLRVGLLVWFYASIRDHYFTIISLFVLAILLYSFFGSH